MESVSRINLQKLTKEELLNQQQIHPDHTSDLPDGNYWYFNSDELFEIISKICEICRSKLSQNNLNIRKFYLSMSDNESSRKSVLNEIFSCGCCNDIFHRLKEILMSLETKEQIDLYRELISKKENLNRVYYTYLSIYEDRFNFTDFNQCEYSYEELVIDYEKSVSNYNSKYRSYDISSHKLIDSLRDVISSLIESPDLKEGSDLKEKLNILNAILNMGYSPCEINDFFKNFPCSNSKNYQKSKENFERLSKH